jgi:hypothetical protein
MKENPARFLEARGSVRYAGLNQFSTAETTLELAREYGIEKLSQMGNQQRASVLLELRARAKKINRERARRKPKKG